MKLKRLESVIKRDNNNFDLVRLIAALAVVFAHSFDLFNNRGYHDPIKPFIKNNSPGTLAVGTFFFISGIFISNSFANKPNHLAFVFARIFRIWPGLIVCILISVFIVGGTLTTLPIAGYLSNKATWQYLTGCVFFINMLHPLPGVFNNNHYAGVINGALWTLPIEIKCYCVLFVLCIIGFLKKRVNALIFLAVLLLAVITKNHRWVSFLALTPPICFFTGCLCYAYRQYVVIDYRIGLLMLVLCFLTYNSPVFMPLVYISLLYNSLVFGISAVAKTITLPGDYSYGIYIYGFLIQQVFDNVMPGLNPYQSMLLTLPCTIAMGILSWYLVERPSIRFGKKLSKLLAPNANLKAGN